MSCDSIILVKRSREERLYDVDVYADIPKAATVLAVLSIVVDPLTDAQLEELGSNEMPLTVADVSEWVINDAAITYRDGRTAPIGKVMQGEIGGGNNGYEYTLRFLYSRSDHAGPHEATVMLRVKDEV